MRQHTFFLSSAFPFFGYNGVLSLPWDRVCWFIICMLSHSQLSLQACLWVYRAWNRVVYRAHRQPSHLLPALCFACNASIANEVKGSSRCAKSYRDCRSLSVGGTISFRQMRWRFAQGTILLRQLRMSLCRRDNLISANAEAVCARWSTSIAVAIAVLRKKQPSFRRWQMYFARISNHGSPSRKYHWRPADERSPFASSSVMVKQLRKPWCENTIVLTSQENRRGVSHTPSRWANMKTIAANKTSSFNERVRRREGENEMMAANIIPSLMGMFAAVKGVCDTPLHIYRLIRW